MDKIINNDLSNSIVFASDTVLYLDMDGTSAVWNPNGAWQEPGYYRTLEPMQHMIDAVEKLKNTSNVEVYILSAYPSEGAMHDKNAWLDEHIPFIDSEHRLFVPYGENKAEFLESIGLTASGKLLVSDYSKELHEWSEKEGYGLKVMNGFNGNHGTWTHNSVESNAPVDTIYQKMIDTIQELERSRIMPNPIQEDYLAVYVPSKDETIMAYYGTDDNLEYEDIENGFDSYLNYYVYDGKVSLEEFYERAGDWDEGEKDGGMYMFKSEQMPDNLRDLMPFLIEYHYDKPLDSQVIGIADEELAALLDKSSSKDTYQIYQLKDIPENDDRMFRDTDSLKALGLIKDNLEGIDKDAYELKYEGPLSDVKSSSQNATLEGIFTKFNLHRPEDFRGHSLSVSDIVVLNENAKTTAYFVDDIGFAELPKFFEQAPSLGKDYYEVALYDSAFRASMTDEYSMKQVTGKGRISNKDREEHEYLEALTRIYKKAAIDKGYTPEEINEYMSPHSPIHKDYCVKEAYEKAVNEVYSKKKEFATSTRVHRKNMFPAQEKIFTLTVEFSHGDGNDVQYDETQFCASSKQELSELLNGFAKENGFENVEVISITPEYDAEDAAEYGLIYGIPEEWNSIQKDNSLNKEYSLSQLSGEERELAEKQISEYYSQLFGVTTDRGKASVTDINDLQKKYGKFTFDSKGYCLKVPEQIKRLEAAQKAYLEFTHMPEVLAPYVQPQLMKDNVEVIDFIDVDTLQPFVTHMANHTDKTITFDCTNRETREVERLTFGSGDEYYIPAKFSKVLLETPEQEKEHSIKRDMSTISHED